MTTDTTFEVSLITPERRVLETRARFVAFPAHDGEMGVLRDRAPLLVELGIGRLRVEAPRETHEFFIDGGFAEMARNRLSLLTEQARRPGEIDRQDAARALEEALRLPMGDDPAFERRQRAVQRARMMLKLAAR